MEAGRRDEEVVQCLEWEEKRVEMAGCLQKVRSTDRTLSIALKRLKAAPSLHGSLT